MSCSVDAGIFVGFKFNDVCKSIEEKEEIFVIKYNENTGEPYKKDESEIRNKFFLFGEEVEVDSDFEFDDFGEMVEVLDDSLKINGLTFTYGDGESTSTILIGISIVGSEDIMYGGGDYPVELSEVKKAIEKLEEFQENPKVYLTTSISC
jgi:hypothetical protein